MFACVKWVRMFIRSTRSHSKRSHIRSGGNNAIRLSAQKGKREVYIPCSEDAIFFYFIFFVIRAILLQLTNYLRIFFKEQACNRLEHQT